MRARYLQAHGRHRPRCQGRCLYADVESEHNAVVASASLIVIPTVLFMLLMPVESYWILSGIALVLLALSLAYLLLAMYTEPGILPVEPAARRIEESGRRRPRVTHCVVDGRRHELGAFRAKMCRQTENCVEEFDHFCPWVGNAVGRRNYRYFIAFVTTVSFLALVVGVTSCIHLSATHLGDRGKADEGKPVADVSWADVALMVLVAYTIIVLCSVCGLMCFHMRLIAINQTTNENIRGTYFNEKNPHDHGVWRNCLNFATRPIPQSRVVSFIGTAIDAVRVPTEEEQADDDDDHQPSIEMI
mmetsp:Transcript_1258/g.3801  ORF Transcript_1258/g.3801 Transcript_1258/m.3801 type:complete len:302 (+) Transcript_1258:46-951(+)